MPSIKSGQRGTPQAPSKPGGPRAGVRGVCREHGLQIVEERGQRAAHRKASTRVRAQGGGDLRASSLRRPLDRRLGAWGQAGSPVAGATGPMNWAAPTSEAAVVLACRGDVPENRLRATHLPNPNTRGVAASGKPATSPTPPRRSPTPLVRDGTGGLGAVSLPAGRAAGRGVGPRHRPPGPGGGTGHGPCARSRRPRVPPLRPVNPSGSAVRK